VQCQKRKRDGVRCRANSLFGKRFCALHSELGKAAELGSKGGCRRTVYSPDGLKEFAAPKSAADLRDSSRHLPIQSPFLGTPVLGTRLPFW
jgi:hypothetical protein